MLLFQVDACYYQKKGMATAIFTRNKAMLSNPFRNNRSKEILGMLCSWETPNLFFQVWSLKKYKYSNIVNQRGARARSTLNCVFKLVAKTSSKRLADVIRILFYQH